MAVDTDLARELADSWPSRIGANKYTSTSKKLLRQMADEIDQLRVASACGPVEDSTPDEIDRLLLALGHYLLAVEQHCPCGARPEQPDTHPHVTGCPVAAALVTWSDLTGAGAP